LQLDTHDKRDNQIDKPGDKRDLEEFMEVVVEVVEE